MEGLYLSDKAAKCLVGTCWHTIRIRHLFNIFLSSTTTLKAKAHSRPNAALTHRAPSLSGSSRRHIQQCSKSHTTSYQQPPEVLTSKSPVAPLGVYLSPRGSAPLRSARLGSLEAIAPHDGPACVPGPRLGESQGKRSAYCAMASATGHAGTFRPLDAEKEERSHWCGKERTWPDCCWSRFGGSC